MPGSSASAPRRGRKTAPPPGGREAHDAVTARAVGRPATARRARLAAAGPRAACWSPGRAGADRTRSSSSNAPPDRLAMEPVDVLPVGPYAGSRPPAPARGSKARPDAPTAFLGARDWRRSARSELGAEARGPSAAAGKVGRRMGSVYAIANQKGGVGKTTTAVNIAACAAASGNQVLLCDLDPQCNATVALGLDRDARPSSYDCLIGECSVAEAARPAGPGQPVDRAGEPRPRGRRGRAAPDRGLRREPPADARPGPRAVRSSPCSTARPSLGPGDGQRVGGGRPRDRPRPGRVPGARGARPVPRHAPADPP